MIISAQGRPRLSVEAWLTRQQIKGRCEAQMEGGGFWGGSYKQPGLMKATPCLRAVDGSGLKALFCTLTSPGNAWLGLCGLLCPCKRYVSRVGRADRHRPQTEDGPVEAEGAALFTASSNWTENSGPLMALQRRIQPGWELAEHQQDRGWAWRRSTPDLRTCYLHRLTHPESPRRFQHVPL